MEIIYIDEVMFTQRSVMSTEYSNAYENIQIDHKDFNIKTTAVVAAISSRDGLLLWNNYGKSVDRYKFLDFLKLLHEKVKYRRYILFMDNLRVHKTKVVKEYLSSIQREIIFNVPYFRLCPKI